MKGLAMKFNKYAQILLSSWLALSLLTVLPISVLAENATIETTPLAANSEQAIPAETSQAATVDNSVNLETATGSSTAKSNTDIGSLATGDSTSIATVITTDNLASLPNTDSFNATPNPNSVGDITLSIPSGQNTLEPTLIPINSEGSVSNTITISSSSGDSTASNNTQISQIDTGDAYSNANLINILGSDISAPDIFLGYVTVDGSLTGDILLPSDILKSVKDPVSIPLSPQNPGASSDRSFIVSNTINSNAVSGNLSASGNGTIGSVLSGSANNMLNSFDLVGANVYGQTGLLVFVNVAGTWDGSILSQAPGIKAALIGTTNAGSTPYIIPLDSKTTTLKLNNIINISATSGEIQANHNSRVGNISTGDATTVVNTANILGSNLLFTKQLGILFITILGDWYGSFGFDTPYGNPPATSQTTPSSAVATDSSDVNIKSSFVSISRTAQDSDNSSPSTGINKYSSFDYPKIETLVPSPKSANRTLLDYMIWGIPLIGGGIALGLVNTDKKSSRADRK